MTPKQISNVRDLMQRAFELDYDAAYAVAVALEHATQCEEFRLDAGRITADALKRAIVQLNTEPQ